MITQETKRICWCGNTDLETFSTDYERCAICGTLISQAGLSDEQVQVVDDAQDFYGKEYWFSHQIDDYGQPDIVKRSRQDLPERCVHWLKTLLKYKLPPARVLEMGSAHGGFVGLMRWAGFDAMGLELSPWIVDYAKQTFDVPMLVGALENQDLEPGSLDAIVLFDVLEHLSHPFETMQTAANLLKPDGVFVIQMPHYVEDKTFDQMVSEGDRFLEQLKAIEHLYLLSFRAAEVFFKRLGFSTLIVEPELYSYDMFLVVSRTPLDVNLPHDIDHALMSTSLGRMVLALFDKASESESLRVQLHDLHFKYIASEKDKEERLRSLNEQGATATELQAQNEALQEQLKAQIERYDQKSQVAEQKFKKNHNKRKDLRAKVKSLKNQVKSHVANNQRLEQERDELQAELEAVKASKFWKLKGTWNRLKNQFKTK